MNQREVIDGFLTLGIKNFDFRYYGDQKTICPKCSHSRSHKSDPCLSINIDKGVYKCHNCGWSGSYYQKTFAKLDVPDLEPMAKQMVDYIATRNISAKTLEETNMKMVRRGGKAYIAFPFYWSGEIVNVKYRSKDKRFFQEQGGAQVLFMPSEDDCISSETIVLVEGEFDALAMYEAGVKNVASVPSGALQDGSKDHDKKLEFINLCYSIFENKKSIILALDDDSHGKLTRDELARRLDKERCFILQYPEGCKDANEILTKFGADYLRLAVETATPYPMSGVFAPRDFKAYYDELYDKGFAKGAKTGWENFDKLFTFHDSQLTVVTGISSAGKSTWLDNAIVRLAMGKSDWRFGLFTPEHYPPHIHMERLATIATGKPFLPGYNGRMNTQERDDALGFINNHFYYMYPEFDSYSVKEVLKMAEYMVKRYGINALVIDPWFALMNNIGYSETQFIQENLSKIKSKSRELGIHILLVAHPRKPQRVKTPSAGEVVNFEIPDLYDVSGSANWFNVPDNGIVVHRYFNQDKRLQFNEVKTAKVKHHYIGELGSAFFACEISNSVFTEINKKPFIMESTPFNEDYPE